LKPAPRGRARDPKTVAECERAIRVLLLLLICVGSASPSISDPAIEEAAPPASPTYLGHAVCEGCHRVETEHWMDTLHADVFLRNPRTALERRGCEACHGPGSEHLTDPNDRSKIMAFTRESGRSTDEMNSVCLECHSGGARIQWAGSTHESEDLACSDCHNPMTKMSASNLLRETSVKQTCFSCHPNQRVEFRKRSHMPLFEGKLDCHDCHQPHGSATDPLLRAGSTFELCTNCHSDKRGPFIWEHAPVTEGCTSCHLPHGSNRDSLLVTSPPFLCQQCHAQLGIQNHPIELLTRENLGSAGIAANRDARVIGRGCINCHVQIHGSNHPSGARFHR
jgi:DmsE family decaheme c-type cytochrome